MRLFANSFLHGSRGDKITKYNLEEITGISGEKISGLMSLICDPSLDNDLINVMLLTGLESKSRFEAKKDEIEIVWTGPNKIDSEVRNTNAVIEEMLNSAEKGEPVTIIDYMITSNAEDIVEELNSCLKDGVKIDLIVDKNSVNEVELRKCFAETSLSRPTIYKRKDKESGFYKVHAKVIIIGDRKMLVSSANLTELGTEVNFELGLLVHGPIVEKMYSLIKKMIEVEYFVEN